MTLPVYGIYVDWDCINWAGEHDFTTGIDDITNDVKRVVINRGKEKNSPNYPAATLEMTLENSSGKYYPTAIAGDLVGKVRLWLPVKVEATFGGTTYTLYYGYINRITAYPIRNKKDIYFYATDGIDLLTKTIVVQDMDDKTVMSDGEAVHQVLNAAGWRTDDIACTFEADDDTVIKVGHGLENGARVQLSGILPPEADSLIVYYVVNKTDNAFCISLTEGGGSINFSTDGGAGFYHVILRRKVDNDGGDITNFPDTFEFTKA